jgi:4'-phosphopantetheinyl transferase EntD
MIAKILPSSVVAVSSYADPPEAVLLPEEEPLVARAVDKRRREVTTVRHCARLALAKLGVPPVPLLRGERGAPVWPPGFVGSMTHCDGFRGAAVARDADVLTIGIDAEPHQPLPEGVLDAVALPDEQASVARLSASVPEVHWDRLLFSAKESVYKAWFPLTLRWLGFEEARVTFTADTPRAEGDPAEAGHPAGDGLGGGRFVARLLVPGPHVDGRPLTGFEGRWLVRDGIVATAIAPTTAAA